MKHQRTLFICCAALLLSAVFSPARAQDLYYSWSQRFGDVNDQYADGLATDASDNIIVTGSYADTVDFGGGPLPIAWGHVNIYIAKFDAAGNHIWSQGFGQPYTEQEGVAVATDGSSNVIAAGHFKGTVDFGGIPLSTWPTSRNMFLVKFDPSGNHIWSQGFGNEDSYDGELWVHGMTVDAADNIVVTGRFYGSIDFGGGPLTSAGHNDIFVAKYGFDGNHLWSRRFGDASYQEASAVTTNSRLDVVLIGNVYGTVDFGGGPLNCAGDYDVVVAAFDFLGNHLWSQIFGDGNRQWVTAITTDESDNAIITGHFTGTVDFGGGPLTNCSSGDFYVAKFDLDGNHVWSHNFGDTNTTMWPWQKTVVAADNEGNIAAAGYFEGTLDFGGGPLSSPYSFDIFTVKFDPAGNHIWSESFWGTSSQSAQAIATDESDNLIVLAEGSGDVDFGGGRLKSEGRTDIFLGKFEVNGPVPTMLRAFDAQCRGEAVELSWRLTEIGRDARFFVLRSRDGSPFAELHATLVAIDGLNGAFTDRTVEPGKTYRYRVDVSDEDGRQALFTTQEIAIPVAELTLGPAQPNPFNPQTLISYSVPEAAHVRLIVYDARGALVRTLVDGAVPSGARSATWNGHDSRGGPVSSGVYFVRLESGGKVRTSKIVLLK